jgi:3-hydroxyacyl-[acyl-carrier-protein] dehydratase
LLFPSIVHAMQLNQLDKIVHYTPWQRLTAVKHLSGQERYLQDHFPNFPVMPGVLMLEALFQASACLIRLSNDFATPLVVLKEVRNSKFADFMRPGDTLEIEVEVVGRTETTVQLKGTGKKGETTAVSARLVLELMTVPELSQPQIGESIESQASDQLVRLATRAQHQQLFGAVDIP